MLFLDWSNVERRGVGGIMAVGGGFEVCCWGWVCCHVGFQSLCFRNWESFINES